MSARQNKKQRKGRNNANNRERTVTTLTEDPNTPFLVPTPSEEPAGNNPMSSPFSVASSSAGNANNGPYQMPGNYAFGYNNFQGPMHGNVHQQPHQPHQPPFYSAQPQQQQPILPPGQNDLEVLEKLKELIKNGQHEFYRAVPQPAALASLYLGLNAAPQTQVPHHPEQAPDFHPGSALVGSPLQANPPRPPSPVDLGRRPPRISSKEGWEPSGLKKAVGATTAGGSQPTNNVLFAQNPDTYPPANPSKSLQSNQPPLGGRYNQNASSASTAVNTAQLDSNGKSNSSGPPSAGAKSSNDVHMSDAKPPNLTVSTVTGQDPTSPTQRSARFDSATGPSSASNAPDQNRSSNDRIGHGQSAYGGPRGPSDSSPGKGPLYDGKDDVVRTPRENSWSTRDGVPPGEDRRREADRPLSSPNSRSTVNGNNDIRPSGPGDRGAPPPARDDRYYDRDRDRERDRDRDRREWERERRPYDRFRDNRMTDMRRPPPEQRHYEPDYDRVPLRRYDQKDDPPVENRRPADTRAPSTPTAADDRGAHQASADDRLSSSVRTLPSDARVLPEPRFAHPDSRAPPPDPRASSTDSRPPARGPSFDDRHLQPSTVDDRSSARPPAPPARPQESSASRVAAADDDRGGSRPSPGEDHSSRPQVPLEERITRPSLQDRLSQPPVARPLARQVSLEERLSHPPVTTGDHGGRLPPQSDDRTVRPSGVLDRDRVSSRPGPPDERNISRPAPPAPQDERPRLDDRPGRPAERYVRPLSPVPDGTAHRSATYPPPRSASVMRDDPRAPPKPPPSPPHRDYRRPLSRERVDVRPSTYRPDDRSYTDDRRPATTDIEAPRYGDNRGPFRPFSPPSAADLARDRARMQFPPTPPRALVDAPPYDDRYPPPGGRDWQYPYDRRRDWSAADEEYWKSRPQWERSNPPSDRERFDRDAPPPRWETRDERDRRESFPPARAPSPPRAYDGPPRPLSSRLTDSYSSPAGAADRSYPPPPPRDPPSFSRVRPRSPSPRPRPTDDARPPPKRMRDEAYPSGYYSPPPREASLRRPADYPSRGPSPPPTSGGSSYYDRTGPPPSSGSTTTASLVPGDRDYLPPRDRLDYPPPASYERPRSPPRGGTYPRGGYGRGVDARDDRRYPPPPPMPPSRRP
jgi:hypothetical protein